MKNRIKVLLVIRELIIGGAESQTFELAKGLDKSRFEVVVCALQHGGYFVEKLKEAEVPVRFVPKRWRYDFTVVPRLVSLFRREKPDIVHCVMWTANMWGGLAAKLAMVPRLVLSTRSIETWKRKLHYLTGPLVFNRADLNLANSSEVKQYMIRREMIRPDSIRVVYNGVDLDRFGKRFCPEEVATMRLAMGLPPEGPVVGIVANLSPQKDYPTFLRAASRVVKENREVWFLIVGDGILRAQLEAETARLGLKERIIFVGQRQDVERCLPCMDVFVLSSSREGFSNALIEAMAAGIPVVASRVGGNIDAVRNGESGFLFETGNDDELAKHVLCLISDPQRSRVLGEFGRQIAVREFGMRDYVRRMETIYVDLLGLSWE